VAVNILANPDYIEDFYNGLAMLQHLKLRVKVTQLIGICKENNMFLTQFHPLGSADRLEHVLSHEFSGLNTLAVRFDLCRQYVAILHSLHTGKCKNMPRWHK
jgi:glycoprotein-mannosyl O6-kinase